VAELAQERPAIVGQGRREPGRRVEGLGQLEELRGLEAAAARGALDGGSDVVRRADPGAGLPDDIAHVFMMTGAVPNTGWLDGCVALDKNGFIKTGTDLSQEDLAAGRWPLSRAPHLLETSLPGVFAVGDARGGNIKRVASAVGEGSIAVSFVHKVLHE
jgi:thioredoxin reductase (NADPH)